MSESPIPALFRKLILRIQPTPTDVARYEGHRRTVQTRLRSTVGAGTIQQIGSFARNTALHSGSDLDLMVQLPVESIRRGGKRIGPVTVLNRIRDQLSARYPDTDLRGSGPAVSVRFARNKYMVDVVPAIFVGIHNSVAHYEIPSRDDRWILACPADHNRLLKAEDASTGGKLRHTCQLLKYWMRCREPKHPLHTFTAEMLIATSGICRGASSYADCFAASLEYLLEHLDATCTDPLGVSTEMMLVDTRAKLNRAASALRSSIERTMRANHAESDGNYKESVRLWDLIFNRNFPRTVRSPSKR